MQSRSVDVQILSNIVHITEELKVYFACVRHKLVHSFLRKTSVTKLRLSVVSTDASCSWQNSTQRKGGIVDDQSGGQSSEGDEGTIKHHAGTF